MCFLWILTPHCMWLCKKTKTCICILLLHATCILGFGVVLECWPVRTSTRGSGVMRCDDMWLLLSLDLFITQPWLCDGMLYEMFVFDVLWCSPVFLWEAEMYVYETLDLTIFESSISDTLITFQSPWWDWCVDLFLMMSCCDMFWLDHFGSLWSVLFGILSGCLLRTEVYCDLLEVLFGYLWRTNGYCDLFWDAF